MVAFPRVSRRQICIFILLLGASIGLAWAEHTQTNTPDSVLAVADVHGDFDDLVAILQRVGIIDAQHHWTGGNRSLVQIGDLLDRGPKPREVMDLLVSLEKEAPQAGGRVISLLGNHEMMNIMGDLRYVTAASYASFTDSNSEGRRKSGYQEYVQWRATHAQLLTELPQPLELTEGEWMARHPAGYVEQREAFGPNGFYGKWLRDHPALVSINGVLFVHGGIHPDLANKMTLEAVNTQIRDEIRTFDDIKQYLENEKIILPF